MIREFVDHPARYGAGESSIARKLAALGRFSNTAAEKGRLNENPARMVATPKLPKRVPGVLSRRRDEWVF